MLGKKMILVLGVVAALGIAAPSVAAAAPYHVSGGATCIVDPYYGKSIFANVPTDDRSVGNGPENAYWSVDLFKYTSRGWENVDSSKPWLSALVYSWGIQQINGYSWYFWNPYPYGAPYSYLPFGNLSPGFYAVKEYYRWSDGIVVTQWARFNGGSSTMCQVV